MNTVKGYTKIESRNTIFGLEFFDVIVLVLIYLVVFMCSKNLVVNLLIVALAYFGLCLLKRGKPTHWSSSVIRFLLRPARYPVKRENEEDLFGK